MASMVECRDSATSVQHAGGDGTLLHLPEMGIRGNTRMVMLDKNNGQVSRFQPYY